MIGSLIDYLRLLNKLKTYHDNFQNTGIHNLNDIENIILLIKKCGSVAIKFTQWIIPKLEIMYCEKNEKPEWLTRLEILYEDCDHHDLEYTQNLYFKTFNKQVHDEYEIIDVLGSGSIAQVYLIKDKNTNENKVMKIIHPNTRREILNFHKIFKFIFCFPCIRKKIHTILPFDLNEFIISFYKQCSFIEEANNLLYYKCLYKKNKYLIIPDLYVVSEDILIMSYENGESFDTIQFSEYNYDKTISILVAFINENLLYNNYSHGDLHKGNWKIKNEDNIYKIIIYDFGFCFSTREKSDVVNDIHDIIELYDTNNKTDCEYDKLFSIFKKSVTNSTDEIIKNYMDLHIDELKYNSMDPYKIINHIINIAVENELLAHHITMQTLILGIQNESFAEKCSRSSVFREADLKYKMLNSNLQAINFCKTNDIFLNYSKILEEKIKKYDFKINDIFETNDFSRFDDKIKEFALQP